MSYTLDTQRASNHSPRSKYGHASSGVTPVIYAGIVGLAGVVDAYVRRDPDREYPDVVDYEPRH